MPPRSDRAGGLVLYSGRMLKVIEQQGPYGKRLVSTTPFAAGERILAIDATERVAAPNYQTVQVDRDVHVMEHSCLIYLNHSCSPNVLLDTTALEARAARDIRPNEELSYFYPSTEWVMSQPFVCLCGSPNCIRLAVGARYLPLDVLSRYFINAHIRALAAECLESVRR